MTQTTLNYLQNRNLFSNHYLESLIVDEPVWQEDVTEAFNRIKEIYHSRKDAWRNMDESMLEQFLIKPILEEVLGHHFIPQAKVEKGSRRPDYAFFENDDALSEALEKKGSDDLYLRAISVGDAKRWRVSLDKKDKRGSSEFKYQNPSYQIDQYLHKTQVQWGILTNGHHWRIYYNETSYKLDSYYDVDLATIFETDDVEGFKYFYLFFRRDSFVKGLDGKNFLDQVYDGSVKYAKELGNSLQRNVYEAMKIISEGFFARSENNLVPDEQNLKEVQENTLRLLYRLLFIFYAESGKLLDTGNQAYNALSLESVKNDVAGKIDNRELILPVTTDYWNKLDTLFALINEGSESKRFGLPKETLYIPAYNGGLFDHDKNPFLHTHKVGDDYLAKAINLMARDDGDFIDYSTLGTRQLGSIYEGILEYKLKVAEEDLVAIKEKGKEKWIPKKDAQGKKTFDEVLAGSIYLATDKGERKATGSYYTPDYIVKYIVRNTLGPVLEDKRKAWSEKGLGERPFLHDILDIRVLDPAMGSGHFLVEACEFLANKLVEAWGEAKPEDLESEEVAEHDVHWARREVVRHCIYGVDLNPMAVELAKLSLWLETVAVNKPLTFLDHHLKVGNSLIGAEVKSLKSLPSKEKKGEVENGTRQPTLWDFTVKGHFDKLLKKYGEFASHPDDDLACVKEKEHQYDALQKSELNMRIHELANVWVSTYFGVVPPPDEYADLQNEMHPGSFPDWSRWRDAEWFRRAQEVAGEKSFFHWELEFPDVFYEKGAQKVNPGWDAVVGNPPYIRVHNLDDEIKNYLWIDYSTYQAKSDILNCFIQRGVELVQDEGYFGYITSDTWRVLSSATPLRKFILDANSIKCITILPDKVFEDASVKPVILITERQTNTDNRNENLINICDLTSNDEVKIASYVQKEYTEPNSFIFHHLPQNHIILRNKMESVGEMLEKCVDISFGLKTGDDSIFIKQTFDNPDDQKVIASESVERYYLEWNGIYVWYVPEKMKNHRKTARPGTKERFEKEKLVISRMADRLSASYDCDKYYIKDAFVCHIKSNLNLKFVLSILNSKLMNHYYKEVFTTVDFHRNELLQLPIRRISFTTPADRRTARVDEEKSLYSEYLGASDSMDRLLDFVGLRIAAEPEESDVVHDLLAHLAEHMIDMNKEKNIEIKAFLGFLEGEIGAAVDDMTNKTAIREYYNHEFQKLIDILVKNKKKLRDGYDPKTPNNYRHLNEWYDDSMNKLQPLMGRIEATDELIDQIVYKLYGLNEEEIKIVEESISGGKNE